MKNKSIVTSFRAKKGLWKKLKIVSAIEGVAIQDKLNNIIDDYVNSNYGHLLKNADNDAEEE
tara:strand:- start:1878 stop:2063 length:186 start_codon:yes stop_codon:yes gene_type:complete